LNLLGRFGYLKLSEGFEGEANGPDHPYCLPSSPRSESVLNLFSSVDFAKIEYVPSPLFPTQSLLSQLLIHLRYFHFQLSKFQICFLQFKPFKLIAAGLLYFWLGLLRTLWWW
jgi:hypothetical protein